MSYGALIDHIINEGDKTASDIMAKARENADTMKARIAAELKTKRENAYHELQKVVAGNRIKKLNIARLKASAILAEAKGDVIVDLFKKCDSALQSILEDSSYPVILLQLLIEGLKHMQGRVEVVVNSKDVTLIRSFLKNKESLEKEECVIPTKVGIQSVQCVTKPLDSRFHGNDDFCKSLDINIVTCEVISVNGDDRIKGGIEIISEDNSVSIVNTVWSRLEKVREDVMPEIGDILFG